LSEGEQRGWCTATRLAHARGSDVLRWRPRRFGIGWNALRESGAGAFGLVAESWFAGKSWFLLSHAREAGKPTSTTEFGNQTAVTISFGRDDPPFENRTWSAWLGANEIRVRRRRAGRTPDPSIPIL